MNYNFKDAIEKAKELNKELNALTEENFEKQLGEAMKHSSHVNYKEKSKDLENILEKIKKLQEP